MSTYLLAWLQTRDQARRLITLVDELYLHNVRLVCTAEVPPEGLFVAATSDSSGVDLEQLQFESAAEGANHLFVEAMSSAQIDQQKYSCCGRHSLQSASGTRACQEA